MFICRVLGVLVLFLCAGSVYADTWMNELRQIGVRSSIAADNKDENFYQTDLVYSARLPWVWQLESGRSIGSRLDLTAGRINAGGDDAMAFSIGPSFHGTTAWRNTYYSFGISPTYITRRNYGEEKLGSRFHFTSFAGITRELTPSVHIGVRFQHMSNAGMGDRNPGLNLLMLELRYTPQRQAVLAASDAVDPATRSTRAPEQSAAAD